LSESTAIKIDEILFDLISRRFPELVDIPWMQLIRPFLYVQASSNFAISGRDGSQKARKMQRLNFDQNKMPIPPKKKTVDKIVSMLKGQR
jgi:hypothetical protein